MPSITLRRVRTAGEPETSAIAVTLFRDDRRRVCGWFIGPVQIGETGVHMAFLPRQDSALASVAVVRAIEAARTGKLPLCVIDPDDLWDEAWG